MKNGEFSFTKMVITRKPGSIFGQNMPVLQAIYVERDDKLYQLWYTSKVWEPVKPLSDLLLRLNADSQNKEIHHEVDTRMRWYALSSRFIYMLLPRYFHNIFL